VHYTPKKGTGFIKFFGEFRMESFIKQLPVYDTKERGSNEKINKTVCICNLFLSYSISACTGSAEDRSTDHSRMYRVRGLG
jgi:hypothetical protein